ncbi:MAG: hypothetical protein HYZ15_06935 [Sphingobacteriales bacterium]|nr:hypothetical protein [Sphingobacteriales bacterium]
MKKALILAASSLLITLHTTAQPVTKELKEVLQLPVTREGGANGAAVAWHPVLKRYYTAIGGNVNFPLDVFDIMGKRVSDGTETTLFDIRGLWYNPKRKTLQMNGYNDFGWAEYKLNTKGIPVDTLLLHGGMNQPFEQSAGAFNPQENIVYFLNENGQLEKYDYNTAAYLETRDLYLGLTEDEDDGLSVNAEVIDNYNTTVVIFTRIKGAEIGVLNHVNLEIELYNLADGYITRILKLPEGAPVNSRLNFSYSNGIYWLFDKETRVWKGYK